MEHLPIPAPNGAFSAWADGAGMIATDGGSE